MLVLIVGTQNMKQCRYSFYLKIVHVYFIFAIPSYLCKVVNQIGHQGIEHLFVLYSTYNFFCLINFK